MGAAQVHQRISLFCGLDPFGNHLQVQAGTQGDDGFDDVGVLRVAQLIDMIARRGTSDPRRRQRGGAPSVCAKA